jgi:hypothetical protein
MVTSSAGRVQRARLLCVTPLERGELAAAIVRRASLAVDVAALILEHLAASGCLIWTMRIIVVVMAAGLLRASTAGADDLVASASQSELLIERVGAQGVETVYQEPLFASHSGATQWAWSDPRTLWVLRREGDRYATTRLTVAKIVDGKAEPEREITLADFKLANDPDPDGRAIDWGNSPGIPRMIVTRRHGVWVQRIVKIVKYAGRARDFKLGYLRVDRAATLARALPAESDIVFDDEPQHQPELPAVAAPPGYSSSAWNASVLTTDSRSPTW